MIIRIPGFKIMIKADLRYEDTILDVFPIKTPPLFPNLSTFFYLCIFICIYDEAGVGWVLRLMI